MLCAVLLCCTKKKKDFLFTPIASSHTKIDFTNRLNEQLGINIFNYLYYYNGAGVSAGDYNGDGKIDVLFCSNQGQSELYLNKGDFVFEKSDSFDFLANENGNNFVTGISNVDVNNDGKLDLYICVVSGLLNLEGHNLLFINQGNDIKEFPVFKEESAKYGLDFKGFSTQAAFFDYDLDGDLDMFLLNHSLHPNGNYGRGSLRKTVDPKAGDRLYKNDNGKFVDVSEQAGIYQGKIGYGLGLSLGDVNNDGYPDIYVGNDFFENDYLYINQKNGLFKEIIAENDQNIGHTSHFSMGNSISDLNNDGLLDIVSLDMLPEELKTYKTSGLEYPYQNYQNYLRNGYQPQFMQNSLQLNMGDLNFSEIGYYSGIAATEWSWSVLSADFDNDMHQDLYFTNGIKGATNDMDFISYAANEAIQKRLSEGNFADYSSLINKLPAKKTSNYIFKNNGNLLFTNENEHWMDTVSSYSHGAVYADLDNDGDLDLVVNNTDEEAFVLKNNSKGNNYLDVEFIGPKKNVLGIGSKVVIYAEDNLLSKEHYLNQGFLSSVAPGLHFGLKNVTEIDSIKVTWPGGQNETRYNLATNQTLNFNYNDAGQNLILEKNSDPLLVKVDSLINTNHKEQGTVEFNREILIPFGYSNQGPPVAVADFNGDGLEDIALGGGKSQALALWQQNPRGTFEQVQKSNFDLDAINEDTAIHFCDTDQDGDQDLIVASGGNEFISGEPLRPRLYLNTENGFVKDTTTFQDLYCNASSITTPDLNADGWPDLCITSNSVPRDFSGTPKQYLFLNEKGHFKPVSAGFSDDFSNMGNVQEITWEDLDNNGYPDAIAVGHWMPITLFMNDGKKLEKITLQETKGWWNCVGITDLDADGDLDFVAGNWGLNSRFEASAQFPIQLYANDFDDNGTLDPVVTYFFNGIETPFASFDELTKQMPFLKKKYLSYSAYAKNDFSTLFSEDKIDQAVKKEVNELASCYFENMGNGDFKKHLLPAQAQFAPIFDLITPDLNDDTYPDLLVVGNTYEISTQLGRLDALRDNLFINDKKGTFSSSQPIITIPGAGRAIGDFKSKNNANYIITRNGDAPIILKKIN
ncbi:VCBS repeat-containing protein [Flavimarina sp. Hel_I_48]|uniref:VCBS repeat-containing protein n=1 Tax=Flavimarina sp. Hel_I_48 TaxID=1392488 RepID=UPI0004DF8892|nr:VCBS repeat-containing protein [Flavimarina sp. Hel_I_48]